MLTELAIRDFAIVDHLELELAGGMTAITGETGAGKSILLGALGLCLGERADSASVRHGCERADLSARFDIHQLPGPAPGSRPASCLRTTACCAGSSPGPGAPRPGSTASPPPWPTCARWASI